MSGREERVRWGGWCKGHVGGSAPFGHFVALFNVSLMSLWFIWKGDYPKIKK